jgi:hypothetical protein
MSTNYKQFNGFIDESEKSRIISYVDSINEEIILNDHHLKHLISKLNGMSYMYDISKTEMTEKITAFQSGGHVMKDELPPVFYRLIEKITSTVGIPQEHMFLQIVDMNHGGAVHKHYDAAFPGYVNYKCNISVLSEDYEFTIDDQTVYVKQSDLYCFEASLYKHWTPNPFTGRRILLSFGFMVPYDKLGRNSEDPRVRLSNRILKYFQK